jgi:hypothetical protein
MTEKHLKKLTNLSNSTYGDFLIEYLETVKDNVADVRNKLNCDPEIQNQVRVGICDALDELVIDKLKHLSGKYEEPEDNWE